MLKSAKNFSARILLVLAGSIMLAESSICEQQGRPKKPRVSQSKEVFVRYTEQKISGRLFVHRVDVVNGVRKEQWAIDKVLVPGEEYEEALLEAEKAESRAEHRRVEALRKKEELDVVQQQDFVRNSRVAVERKRLQLVLDQVEGELTKIRDPKLAPYYVFSDAGIASSELLHQLCDELIPKAKELCAAETVVLEEVSNIAAMFEQQPARLRALFRETVNNAINKCDDTRFLKELLENVA